MTIDIIFAVLQLFGVCCIGWLARYLGYLDEADVNKWSRFIVDFLFPLLVFHSIVTGFNPDRLPDLWPLPFLGLGMIVLGAAAGFVLRGGVRSSDPDLRKTFHHFCAVNNYGFLPLIIVQNLWGAEGLAKLFFLNLGSSIGYWTIGVGLLGGTSFRAAARHILNPGIVALALALVVCLTGWNRVMPQLVLRIPGSAGAASIPCMLAVIGAALYPFPQLKDKRDLGYLSFTRLALLPALAIGLLALAPLEPDVRNIAIIVALMPASVSSTILTRRYGGSPDFAARVAVVTTILSLVTIPVALVLLEKMLNIAP